MQLESIKKKGQVKNHRSSVSAEVYGLHNEKQEFVAKVIEKTPDQIAKLTEKMNKSFLFNSLDDKDFKTVLDAMEQVNFPAGEQIITQGDPGNVLYLIYSGNLDCFKTFVI